MVEELDYDEWDKIAQLFARRSSLKMVDDIIKWLEDREKILVGRW